MWNISNTLLNYIRCASEIKSRIAVAKTAFNKKALYNSKLDLN
jgi:hypothetical protein